MESSPDADSARANIAHIVKHIRLLPNRKLDAPTLLRAEFARFLELFKETKYADEVFVSTREEITQRILSHAWNDDDDTNDPIPFGNIWSVEDLKNYPYDYWPDGKIWTWEGFWNVATPMINEYIKSLNYLITFRWLQRQIWLCETSTKSNGETKENIKPDESYEGIEIGQKPTEKDIFPKYERFVELYSDPNDFKKSIQALQQIRPDRPVINDAGSWIGGPKDGSKGVLVAWIERLEHCKKIHKLTNRKELVKLLNNHFTNLRMGADARIFDNITDENLRLGFAALIPE